MIIKNSFGYHQKKSKVLSSKILNIQAIKSKTTKKVSRSGATSLHDDILHTGSNQLALYKWLLAISPQTDYVIDGILKTEKADLSTISYYCIRPN